MQIVLWEGREKEVRLACIWVESPPPPPPVDSRAAPVRGSNSLLTYTPSRMVCSSPGAGPTTEGHPSARDSSQSSLCHGGVSWLCVQSCLGSDWKVRRSERRAPGHSPGQHCLSWEPQSTYAHTGGRRRALLRAKWRRYRSLPVPSVSLFACPLAWPDPTRPRAPATHLVIHITEHNPPSKRAGDGGP